LQPLRSQAGTNTPSRNDGIARYPVILDFLSPISSLRHPLMTVAHRLSIAIAIFLAIALWWPASVMAQSPQPSFDCKKARAADEHAICADEKLAQMDQAVAIALSQVDKDSVKLARQTAYESLLDRHGCGANKLCIVDNQAQAVEILKNFGAKTALPPWIGAYRLSLLEGKPLVNDLPTAVGACTKTKIAEITTRFGDELKRPATSDVDAGSAVNYANDGHQVSYSYDEALAASAVGDDVILCLISVPRDCPAGDDRGRVYSATNLRTKGFWIMPDSQHSCGGA
jgi:uncharacterized protein